MEMTVCEIAKVVLALYFIDGIICAFAVWTALNFKFDAVLALMLVFTWPIMGIRVLYDAAKEVRYG